MGIKEILTIGSRRVNIEECFRNMKSSLNARPIHVRTPEHIEAHLYSVYISLVLLYYLRLKYKLTNISSEELLNAIKNYQIADLDNGIYKTLTCNKTIKLLFEKLDLPLLDKLYFTNGTLINAINSRKGFR